MRITHVTITQNDHSATYRLGQVVSGDKIQCLNDKGLVERVCYWPRHGITDICALYTGGCTLRFHDNKSP